MTASGTSVSRRKSVEGTPAVDKDEKQLRWRKAKRWMGHQVKSSCSPTAIKRRIPIIGWIRGYNLEHFQCDIIAGLTVGLTVIPQGIAYASVASLPLQYGLYTGFMGCFMYALLGSTPQVNIGPTAIIALLTAQVVTGKSPDYAVVLGFISGIIELAFVVCRLGFLIDFISVPVISGFSSAAALIISATQLKSLLGIKLDEDKFGPVIYGVFKEIKTTKIPDLIMGLSSLVVLLSLRRLGSVKWDKNDGDKSPSMGVRVFRKTIWLICTGRNALVVVIAGLIAYILSTYDINVFSLTGEIKGGLPVFQPPPFSTQIGNDTVTFVHILQDLGTSIALVPLVSILEHIAIAKVFAQGKCVDAKQEFLALGVANVMGSFVSAFPSTGSFSRTALNGSCGVKTPLGGLYTGALVLLALGFLASSFKFIPKASLSAVIISAVIFMIEYEMVPHLWKTKKLELVVMILTFGACLGLGAEYGILVGILLSILMLLYTAARPSIQIERTTNQQVEFIHIQPDQNLFFPALEYLRFRIKKAANCDSNIPVVFDGSHISTTDFTVAQGIKQILDDFRSRNQKIVFTNIKQEIIDLLHNMEAEDVPHVHSLDDLESVVHIPEKAIGKSMVINNTNWHAIDHPEIEHFEPINGTAIEAIVSNTYSKVWPNGLKSGNNALVVNSSSSDEVSRATEAKEVPPENEVRAGLLSTTEEDDLSAVTIDFGKSSTDNPEHKSNDDDKQITRI